MKVQLTERRHVEAEGKWFKARVSESSAIISTDFGQVIVRRTREGIDVVVERSRAADTFFEYKSESTPLARDFDTERNTISLRTFGQVTMGEMDDVDLRAQVENWRTREKK